MSFPLRIINAAELDSLSLSVDPIENGPTGPTGISSLSTGPTGSPGTTGSTGNQGPTGISPSIALFYSPTSGIAAGTRFLQFNSTFATETNASVLMPSAGQLLQLTVYYATVPTSAGTYTVRINGVNTALAVTASTSGATTATSSIPFNAGDRISIQAVNTNTSPISKFCLLYSVQ